MPEFHFSILPLSQAVAWNVFSASSKKLQENGLYLAGGTALALQIGHRQSIDFDFFSQKRGLRSKIYDWLESCPDFIVRDMDENTLHAELKKIKVSFIGNFRYPLIQKPVRFEGVTLASIADIGLMKLLAITHRATLRDYIDLAAILRTFALQKLLKLSRKKYGPRFNLMIPLKALVSFEDLDEEMPILLDKRLKKNWREILKKSVKEVSR